MNILQVVPSLESRHGGPSRSARGLSFGLAELGQDVTLFTTGPKASSHSEQGTRIHCFRRGAPAVICPSAGLKQAMAAETPDVIHHHGIWLRTLHYAYQSSRRSAVPLIISPRGMMTTWAWQHHRRRKAWANRIVHPGALANAAGWHATSQAEANDIRALGFTQPICISGNGVTLPDEAQLTHAKTYWEKELPEAADRKVALYYGRFHSKKRVLDLIDLWQQLAPPRWILALVGIPSEYSVRELENYAARQPGPNRIAIFDGTHTPAPYAIASLSLLPSHSENFGLTVAESLAAGVPAVVTDATPWREMAAEGAGWWVPWESFSETLEAALNVPTAETIRMGERGRAWIGATHGWNQMALPLVDFYQSLRSSHVG